MQASVGSAGRSVECFRSSAVGRLLAAASVLAALSGCGGSEPPKPRTVAAQPEAPRDAAKIADQITGGRVSALIYMDRVRASPLGKKLDANFRWRRYWEGTGLDPERDIDRVYATAPSLSEPQKGLWVMEVNVPLERVKAAIDVLYEARRTKGNWVEGARYPEARVEIRDGSTRSVVLVPPRWVVLLPVERVPDAARFAKSGGFPDPIGAEAITLSAADPAHTLQGRYASFEVPETLSSTIATVTLTVDGGLEIGVEGVSTTSEQAEKDAADLTEMLDKATSVGISKLRVSLVDPIVFRPDGRHVRGRRTVPSSEFDMLLKYARPKQRAVAQEQSTPTSPSPSR